MPLKSYLLPILAVLAISFASCKKNSKAGEPAPQEAGLVASLDGVTEGTYTAAPGSTYAFDVKISSEMPVKGVTIKVDAVTDPGGIVIPQDQIQVTTSGTIKVTLTGLKPLQTVKVTLTITSAGNNKNEIVKTFYITNKEPQ